MKNPTLNIKSTLHIFIKIVFQEFVLEKGMKPTLVKDFTFRTLRVISKINFSALYL